MRNSTRLTASLLIGLVLLWNLQAALIFVINPFPYITSFQLEGNSGRIMVQGLGVLFLMWNVPYFFACWNPLRYRISLIEANLMQLIGLIGETLLRTSLPPNEVTLRATASRFILFDGAGLLLLLIALWITRSLKSHSS